MLTQWGATHFGLTIHKILLILILTPGTCPLTPDTSSPMQFSHIKETCLYLHDLDAAEAFYHGKLGLPLIHRDEGRHIFFRAGASVLLCFIAESSGKKTELPAHFAEGNQHFAFACKAGDYEAWKTRIEAAGIPITHEQVWSKGHRSFYFEDPESNVLEIVEPGMWGEED